MKTKGEMLKGTNELRVIFAKFGVRCSLDVNNGCEHEFEWCPDELRKKANVAIWCYKCRTIFSPRMLDEYVKLVKKEAK